MDPDGRQKTGAIDNTIFLGSIILPSLTTPQIAIGAGVGAVALVATVEAESHVKGMQARHNYYGSTTNPDRETGWKYYNAAYHAIRANRIFQAFSLASSPKAALLQPAVYNFLFSEYLRRNSVDVDKLDHLDMLTSLADGGIRIETGLPDSDIIIEYSTDELLDIGEDLIRHLDEYYKANDFSQYEQYGVDDDPYI